MIKMTVALLATTLLTAPALAASETKSGAEAPSTGSTGVTTESTTGEQPTFQDVSDESRARIEERLSAEGYRDFDDYRFHAATGQTRVRAYNATGEEVDVIVLDQTGEVIGEETYVAGTGAGSVSPGTGSSAAQTKSTTGEQPNFEGVTDESRAEIERILEEEGYRNFSDYRYDPATGMTTVRAQDDLGQDMDVIIHGRTGQFVEARPVKKGS